MDKTYELIHDLCKARKTSIPEMCKETGLSRSLFAELKSGRTKRLSIQTMETVAGYLKVPVTYFLDLGEPNTKDIPPEPPISDSQLMFALWGDVKDELTEEDLEEVRAFAHMKYLQKKEKKEKERMREGE